MLRARDAALFSAPSCSPSVESPMGPLSPPRRSRWLTEDYECTKHHKFSPHPNMATGCRSADDVQIRMIDFAHTLRSADGAVDAGYIYGLNSLLKTLSSVLRIIDTIESEQIFRDIGEIMIRASTKLKNNKSGAVATSGQ